MPPAEQTTLADISDFGEVLAELGTEAQSTDAETRQGAALLTFGRRAGANPDPSILVADAAALLASTFQADYSSVGEVVADGSTLSLKVGQTGEDGKPLDRVVHKMSLDAADSMAGAALATAQPVIVEKLGAEKQFADLALRKLDIVSALTVPLHVDNKPFGTLGVYTTQERALAKRDVCFAETIAHMLTNSIARSRTEQQLSDHRKRTSTILKIIESLVFELDSEFKLVSMNRACRDATGFTLREIVGKPFSSVFVIPEELDLVQGILRSSVRDRAICEFESSLLTKDGEQRRVAWSLSVLRDDDGTPKSILLTGTDRTELADAQLRLEKAEALAQQAATQLQELRQEVAEQVKTSGRPAVVDGRPEGPPADGEDTSGPDGSNPVQEDEPANTTRREPAPETDDTPSPSMIRLPNGSLGPEARTSVRRSFHYKQLIAPMYGSVIPSRKEFFQVRCENISAGGFAFYIEREPDFEHLIVALGQGTALTYFSARIVRVMKKDVDGEELHLVGCRFSGRIHL